MKYHYFHRFLTYSVRRELDPQPVLDFGVKRRHLVVARPAPTTVSGGEFDWGGTSVKA